MDAFPLKQSTIDGDMFLAVVLPALKECDAAALARSVTARWKPRDVCQLLKHVNVDVRRVATMTMGMIGDTKHVSCLTNALRDPDAQVNQMAEHALWSIWFRSGSPNATQPFREGLALLTADLHNEAKEKFLKAAAIDPTFAEAYNQCGIACYLSGDYAGCIAACKQAIKLIPTHFGAIAGMGHCFTQQGELSLALRCYRRARKINPQLEGIGDAIARLETKIKDMSDSGFFELSSIA